ncbi:recombinase family protein [Actinoplanes sp. CA-142083]|uniref:recombinase family protein n=1 Tax=Actinoplanes sp. CA-142083 TaxID=3239903 RepID=UPI003D923162
MQSDTPRVMRPILRVSKDKKGRSTSTADQATDLSRDADEHHWAVGPAYVDEGISASRFARQVRGDFARLVADVASGQLDGQIVGLWETSRASRQVDEWAPLLTSMRGRGIHIWVSTHDTLYSPDNGRHRETLLNEAAKDERASEETRDRVDRTIDAGLAAGKVHGDIAYGYKRRYDPETKELVEQYHEPTEAPIVLEVFQRIDKAETLRSISRDMHSRGIRSRVRTVMRKQPDGSRVKTTVGGKLLTESLIREMATNPVYKGHRRGRTGDPQTYRGSWEPIVSEELWDRVNARLRDPARRTQRDSQAKHLLTQIGVCDPCGSELSPTRRGQLTKWRLHCRGPQDCVQVDEAILDEIATDLMVGYLSRPDIVAAILTPPSDDPVLARLRGDIAAAELELVDLDAGVEAGDLTVAQLRKLGPPLRARLERLREEEKRLSAPSALARFVGPADEVRARLAAAPITARREVARLVFSPGLLGELRIAKAELKWCRHEDHERATQTCRHNIEARVNLRQD